MLLSPKLQVLDAGHRLQDLIHAKVRSDGTNEAALLIESNHHLTLSLSNPEGTWRLMCAEFPVLHGLSLGAELESWGSADTASRIAGTGDIAQLQSACLASMKP
jgi:hypothetical protein